MLDFSRSFDRAWERMVAILFRPFDLGKWFVIGFSAFLARLGSAGNGGLNFNSIPSRNSFSAQQHQFHDQFGQITSALEALQVGTIILIACLVVLFIFALSALVAWLGARGQFVFLDNIVRNRPAIADPWQRYSRSANEVFIFRLICFFLGFSLVLIFGIPAVFLVLSAFFRTALTIPLMPAFPSVIALIALGLCYLVVVFGFSIFLFLFREWGIALMFRHPIGVREALRQIWELIRTRPGSIAVFILLRMVLWLGFVAVALITCCFTCCLAVLPYLGSVILLPALIFLRCFSLESLAQFGPDYDVFSVDLPPGNLTPAVSPLPPLG